METFEMMVRRRVRETAKRAKTEKIKLAIYEILGFSCGFLGAKLLLLMFGIQ